METSKKLINSVETCVDEMLSGFVCAHPKLLFHPEQRLIHLRGCPAQEGQVALVSGGGSGHEPFCAGYVGYGMLTAAVAGNVFASPPARNVLCAIRCAATTNPRGVLVIIPNYTGDCLNFGLAAEQACIEGLKVCSLVVGEDCAMLSEKKTHTGRRGMCGLVFVYKIAGATAVSGASLEETMGTAQKVASAMATIGVSLSACSLPGGGPLFKLGPEEMELGLGVHGEAGIHRMKLCSAEKAVHTMLEHLTNALDLEEGHEVAVLINNLGGMSQLELWLICGQVQSQLASRGIMPSRFYVGYLMTSLNMSGVQVSLLKLSGTDRNTWLALLDADTQAPAWPGNHMSIPMTNGLIPPPACNVETALEAASEKIGPELNEMQAKILKRCLEAAAKDLLACEVRLNELDSGCGDGDCGSTLRRFAEGLLKRVDADKINLLCPAVMFRQLADICESSMGGTSGAIYSILMTMASVAMGKLTGSLSGQLWGIAWQSGLDGIMNYSHARLGDRTMLDALIPACMQYQQYPKETMIEAVVALESAVEAAKHGCTSTKNREARAGRASHVSKEQLKDVDAGAYAVFVWLRAVCNEIKKNVL